MKYKFNSTGNSYIKASIRGHFWWRYMEMNPGTTYQDQPIHHESDFSIRRLRATVLSQVGNRWMFYMIVGENNLNKKIGRETNIRILDLNAEYTFSPALSIGFGKTGWGGLSRWNLRSSRTMMALDAPLFALMTVNKNDDLGRMTGVWAQGYLNDFGYVISVKKPLVPEMRAEMEVLDYNNRRQSLSTSLYLKYEFLEKEGNRTAYSGSVGTYLGTKSVFNIGGGMLYQPEMMDQVIGGSRETYDFKNLCLESFLEIPVWYYKAALTHYVGYFYSDFGPDYVRFLGANDYTIGGTTLSGSGNDVPLMGSGSTWFTQVGLFVPFSSLNQAKPKGFQPYAAIQTSSFDGLGEQVWVYDVGLNVLFDGHGQKLSVGYQNRPVFENEDLISSRKAQFVVQYQLEIR